MPKTPPVYDALHTLVDRFEANLDQYKAAGYKEASVRVDYIDKFFELMGWDVRNDAGKAEQYRDVVREDSVEVDGHQKAPDYCFRVGGAKKYFVEAKKPSVNLHDDIAPSLQLRRYSFSARLSLGILTDFEEFSIFDTRVKPDKKDKASTARIFYCTFRDYLKPCTYDGKEYPTTFDFIRSIFSKEAIESGSFDAWATTNTKRGTSEMDKEFLALISDWRENLAKNIAMRNMSITVRDLNLAVQRIIDRLVFIRFAEDRGAERERMLYEAGATKGAYAALMEVFESARIKYNSELFEKNAMIESVQIDDKILADIIKSMYFPDCPYEFSVMPLEILGAAYEQFLGKTVRIEGGEKRHKAVVEEKPEVRKAGGVYYTPQYIVEYIVKETVGVKLEGKTPREAAALTIVDPACGSGSFLIGAYDYLLRWYFDQYTRTPEAKKAAIRDKRIIEKDRGEYRLTLAEKRKILTDSIYGVDIDAQAVEVTKLSLYLKLLEGEGMAGGQVQLALAHEKILPKLDANIKCGNSLIGPDFYDDKDMGLFPDDDLVRINVFDWKASFADVFKAGGFDCVIGNPPYVRQEMLGESKPYFEKRYKVYHGMADLYSYFFERGITLLASHGRFGIIVANKWMRANYGGPLRAWMKTAGLDKVIDFGDLPVFKDATTYPCIIIAERDKKGQTFFAANVEELTPNDLAGYLSAKFFKMTAPSLSDDGWMLMDERKIRLMQKVRSAEKPLGEYVNGKIYYGIKTGLNEAFVIDTATKNRLVAEDPKSAEILKPFLAGRDIKRYAPLTTDKWLIFTRRGINIKEYPAIEKHLLAYKERLMPKPANWKGDKWPGRKPGKYQWYEIQDSIDYWEEFENEKFVLPDISLRGNIAIDDAGSFCVNTCYIIVCNEKTILAVLNSQLITWYYENISTKFRGGYLRFFIQYIELLPIPEIKDHDRMSLESLVSQMIALHAEHASASGDKKTTETRIAAIDRQIDQLVYKLYGLTEDEIRIVEGGV